MKPTLEITKLWKSYKVGLTRQKYKSFRESIGQFSFSGGRKKEIFWALKDINLKIYRGEKIGIIGQNGAGKSTLLKILSRISPPTKGQIIVRGSLSSLLEVGTGFHPELTGRENIFLNGSILGLKKQEILKQFDEIVHFSGVAPFLDTPLKHFSSGMQLRLAFSVAAHLEPDILLIDEVLAVGDAAFQKKCLQKMDDVSKSGRTVVLVSHNLGAINSLCTKCIVLNKGSVSYSGTTSDSVQKYLEDIENAAFEGVWENNIDTNSDILLKKVAFFNERQVSSSSFLSSEEINITFSVYSKIDLSDFSIGFDLIKNETIILRSRQLDTCSKTDLEKGKNYKFRCKIPPWILNKGTYSIRPDISKHKVKSYSKAFSEDVRITFNVKSDPSRSVYHGGFNEKDQPGNLFLFFDWSFEEP